jgi:hypothetical protein
MKDYDFIFWPALERHVVLLIYDQRVADCELQARIEFWDDTQDG